MNLNINDKTLLTIFLFLVSLISISTSQEPKHNVIFVVNITAHNNEVIVEPTCSSAKPCFDGVIIPAWRPLVSFKSG